MGDKSGIEWTNATWNPLRGCTKVSPGCKHCYAETFAERFRGTPGHPYEQGFDLRLVPEKLDQPLRWKKPRLIFTNSMSDLFHEGVTEEFIDKVFAVMTLAPWHTFQVLTKRPARMLEYLTEKYQRSEDHKTESAKGKPAWDTREDFVNLAIDHVTIGSKLFDSDDWRTADGNLKNRFRDWPLSNVWLGVSVEDRRYGLPRIDLLREAPAAVRFLSVEPLLEDLGELDLAGIHWVIVGGESGPGARPMDLSWVRSIRDQCQEQQVPFFFKQIGGARKKEAGRMLDGRTWDEMPVSSANV